MFYVPEIICITITKSGFTWDQFSYHDIVQTLRFYINMKVKLSQVTLIAF